MNAQNLIDALSKIPADSSVIIGGGQIFYWDIDDPSAIYVLPIERPPVPDEIFPNAGRWPKGGGF